MKKKTVMLFTMICILAVNALPVYALPGTGTIVGKVTDSNYSGPVIQGATVELWIGGSLKDTDTTDSNGMYLVSCFVEYKTIAFVKVSAAGYLPKTSSCYIEPRKTTTRNIYLYPNPAPPAKVTGLETFVSSFSPTSNSVVMLWWDANTEPDIKEYYVYQINYNNPDSWQRFSTSETSYIDRLVYTNTPSGAMYYYAVSAVNIYDLEGEKSDEVFTWCKPSVDYHPSAVTGLTAVPLSTSEIFLDWEDNLDIDFDHYHIYRDGEYISESSISEFNDEGLEPSSTHTYSISAMDISYLESPLSEEVSATTDCEFSIGTLTLRNIASDDTLYGTVTVIARATGSFDRIYCQIGGGTEFPMHRIGSTNLFQGQIDSADSGSGSKDLSITVSTYSGSQSYSISRPVVVTPSYLYEIRVEIDYISGYYPNLDALTYVRRYFADFSIRVTFSIGDEITDEDNDGDTGDNDGIISHDEFWILEEAWNDDPDKSACHDWLGYPTYDSISTDSYYLKDKWMLYGPQHEWGAYGMTHEICTAVGSDIDLETGNYLFMAKEKFHTYEESNDLPEGYCETQVLLHEMAHCIGVAKMTFYNGKPMELYDTYDVYSVMYYVDLTNIRDVAGYWYCSWEYWQTRNMEYYVI